jgi:competence protein ComER
MAIGFIGTGSMGQMLIRALAEAGVLAAETIYASNRSPQKLQALAAEIPTLHVTDNLDLARRCNIIFLCVKPGETQTALDSILPALSSEDLLITISNTVDMAKLAAATPCRLFKVVPALPHSLGRGVSLLMPGPRSTAADLTYLRELLGHISLPQVIGEEQGRIAANVTSCGPAFLSFMFLSLAEAAHQFHPELSQDTFRTMVLETVGATAELYRAGLTPEEILRRVSTPGGITMDGLALLEEHLPRVWQQLMQVTIEREEAKKARVDLRPYQEG